MRITYRGLDITPWAICPHSPFANVTHAPLDIHGESRHEYALDETPVDFLRRNTVHGIKVGECVTCKTIDASFHHPKDTTYIQPRYEGHNLVVPHLRLIHGLLQYITCSVDEQPTKFKHFTFPQCCYACMLRRGGDLYNAICNRIRLEYHSQFIFSYIPGMTCWSCNEIVCHQHWTEQWYWTTMWCRKCFVGNVRNVGQDLMSWDKRDMLITRDQATLFYWLWLRNELIQRWPRLCQLPKAIWIHIWTQSLQIESNLSQYNSE